jgi:hypothetical protein
MAATTFIDGSFLTPTFVNTLYQAGGGHVHDGVDADGHAPKINLANQVTAALPMTSLAFKLRGYIDGLTTNVFLSSGTLYQITVKAGQCMDDTNTQFGTSAAPLVKSLSNTGAVLPWVAGASGGAGATGISYVPGSWYYIFALINTAGAVDFIMDNDTAGSHIAATATGYAYKRRIAAIYATTAGAFRFYQQYGDFFGWASAPIAQYSGDFTDGATSVLVPLTGIVPAAISMARVKLTAIALYANDTPPPAWPQLPAVSGNFVCQVSLTTSGANPPDVYLATPYSGTAAVAASPIVSSANVDILTSATPDVTMYYYLLNSTVGAWATGVRFMIDGLGYFDLRGKDA